MSVDAKLQIETNQKANAETNRICGEAIELLNSYWIKRDTNIESIAYYKGFRVVLLGNIATTASGQVKNSEIS